MHDQTLSLMDRFILFYLHSGRSEQAKRTKVQRPLTIWTRPWDWRLPSGRGSGSLVIVRIAGWSSIVQEIARAQWGVDGVKGQRRLVEIETVGKVVGVGIGVPKRGKTKVFLHEVQDAAKVMIDVRDMCRFRVRGNHDQGHAEPVDIARSPTGAIRDDLRRRHVVEPSAPIVPRHNDGSVGPIGTVANSVDDRSHPGRAA